MAIGSEFITIRPDTSQFSPELQAALTAAIEGAERSVEDIDINAELAATTLGKLEAQTAAAVQGVESSIEEIDVGAGLAPSALSELTAETAAVVQAVESSTETINIKAGLDPKALGVLKAETQAAATSASGSFGKITSAAGATGIAIAAVAAAGVIAVKTYTDLTEQVRDFSAVTGASLEQSSRIVEVFGDLGFNADAAERAFFLLNKNIATGSANLEKFGVETVKAADGSTDYIETLLSIATAYQTAGTDAEKTGILFAAFGKSGASLAPILNQNADALRAMFAAVSDKKIITAEDIAQAQDLRLAFDSVVDAIQDLLLPAARALTPLLASAASAIGPLLTGVGKLFGLIGSDLTGALAAAGVSAFAFKRALDGAALSGASASVAFTSVSGAVGVAAAAMVGFQIGTALGKQIFGDYVNEVDALAASLLGLQDPGAQAVLVFDTLTSVAPNVITDLDALGISLADLTTGLGTNSAEIGLTVGALETLRDEGKLSAQQYEFVVGALQQLDDATNQNTTTAEIAAGVTAELGTATGELGDELDVTKTAFELQEDAISSWSAALEASLGGVLGLHDAQRTARESGKRLTEALDEGGRALAKNSGALDDHVEDLLAEVDAQVLASDATESDAEIKQLQLDKLRALRDKYPELATQIQGYIDIVKKTPAKATTDAEFNSEDARGRVRGFENRIGEIPANVAGTGAQIGNNLENGIRNSGIFGLIDDLLSRILNLGSASSAVGGGGGFSGGQGGGGGGGSGAGGGGQGGGSSGVSSVQNITINEVASDPRATAAAVSARLGVGATR